MYVLNETIIDGASVDKVYPVNSLYFSEGLDPNAVFKGTTWIRTAKGQVLVGVDESDADYSAPRKSGGAKTVTLSANHLPAHSHPFTGKAVNANTVSHSHNLMRGGGILWNTADNYNSPSLNPGGMVGTGHMSTTGAHTHTCGPSSASVLANAGSGGAHNNLQPYVVCEIWERTA